MTPLCPDDIILSSFLKARYARSGHQDPGVEAHVRDCPACDARLLDLVVGVPELRGQSERLVFGFDLAPEGFLFHAGTRAQDADGLAIRRRPFAFDTGELERPLSLRVLPSGAGVDVVVKVDAGALSEGAQLTLRAGAAWWSERMATGGCSSAQALHRPLNGGERLRIAVTGWPELEVVVGRVEAIREPGALRDLALDHLRGGDAAAALAVWANAVVEPIVDRLKEAFELIAGQLERPLWLAFAGPQQMGPVVAQPLPEATAGSRLMPRLLRHCVEQVQAHAELKALQPVARCVELGDRAQAVRRLQELLAQGELDVTIALDAQVMLGALKALAGDYEGAQRTLLVPICDLTKDRFPADATTLSVLAAAYAETWMKGESPHHEIAQRFFYKAALLDPLNYAARVGVEVTAHFLREDGPLEVALNGIRQVLQAEAMPHERPLDGPITPEAVIAAELRTFDPAESDWDAVVECAGWHYRWDDAGHIQASSAHPFGDRNPAFEDVLDDTEPAWGRLYLYARDPIDAQALETIRWRARRLGVSLRVLESIARDLARRQHPALRGPLREAFERVRAVVDAGQENKDLLGSPFVRGMYDNHIHWLGLLRFLVTPESGDERRPDPGAST